MNSKPKVTVGISDLKFSRDPNSILITHSLGPCIGLILFDPATSVGGLLHYQLPTSKGHEQRAQQNPFMFADTGIPLMFRKIEALGAAKKRLSVSIFGGASMLQDDKIFKIGVQNTRAAKKLLWQECVSIKNEEVGGKTSRTITIDIATGEIGLKKDGNWYRYN